MAYLRRSLSFALTVALIGMAGVRAGRAACPDFSAANVTRVGGFGLPDAIAAGDFNRDGKLDLAVAGLNSGAVWILLNNGSGGFNLSSIAAVGSSLRSITAGDLNRDGKIDLVLADSNGGSVVILLGNGDGTFATGTPITGLGTPFSAAIGDVNGDGIPDLAVANQTDNSLSIHIGNGSGGFTTGTPVTAGISAPNAVTLADLNGDGNLDLVVANSTSNTVVLRGNGSGGFTANFTGPTSGANSAWSDTVGDLNGDGRPDIVQVNWSYYGQSSIAVFLQTAAGTFPSTPATYTIGNAAYWAVIGDFTGDGKPDIAAVNGGASNVSLLTNSAAGDGTFTVTGPFGTQFGPQGLVAGDFNGDGRLDLATPNYNSNSVTLLSNTSSCSSASCGIFAAASTFSAATDPSAVATGDFNKDGILDLAIPNQGSNNVSILLGNSSGGFGTATNFTTGNAPVAVAVADLNRDGNLDLAVVNGSGNSVSILLGAGDGTFGAKSDFAVGTGTSGPAGIAVGDFDRDGRPDLAVTCATSLELTILINGTAAAASTPVFGTLTFSSGAGTVPRGIAVLDVDRDGKLDLAVANDTTPAFASIYIGDGFGDFTLSGGSSYTTNAGSKAIASGDFNRDGYADLAVANATTGDVSILLSDTFNGFQAPVNLSFGGAPRAVVVGDFNGDGSLDVATANTNGTIGVRFGAGNGTFGDVLTFGAGTNTYSVASGDFDRDGKPDLVAVNNATSTSNVSVLINSCTDLTVVASHTGDFIRNQTGTLTITVSNGGGAATVGTVTVVDTLPAGLTATGFLASNWNCTLGTPVTTCTRNDPLASSGSYEAITLTVSVAGDALSPLTNSVTVSGGGETNTSNDTAGDSITVLMPPVLTASFGAATIALNGTTTLSFHVTNPNGALSLSGVGFFCPLPLGLAVSSPVNGLTGNCGGTITATPGAPLVSLSGLTLAAGTDCTFSLNVTGTTAGVKPLTTASITSNEAGNGDGAVASLIVDAPPAIIGNFGASSMSLSHATDLQFHITNPNSTPLTGVSFTDNLPNGLKIETPNNLTGSCGGGSITAVSGTSTISLSGATLAGNTSCTFSVIVSALAGGTYDNSVTVSSTEGGTGNTYLSSILVIGPPVLGKVWAPSAILVGSTTTLTYTVSNPNPVQLTGVTFTDYLPVGLSMTAPAGLTGPCAADVTLTGGQSIAFLNATVPALGTCSFSVNVAGFSPGTKISTTSTVASTEGGTGPSATANLDVVAPPDVAMNFGTTSIQLGALTSMSIFIDNPPDNGVALTQIAVSDTLPAGLVVATPNGLVSGCAGATITAQPGSTTVGLSGGTLSPGVLCTFTVNVMGIGTGHWVNTTGNVTSANGGTGGTASAALDVVGPDLSITKTHSATFTQGSTGKTYTITVSNVGGVDTSGAVTVTDSLPAGLTPTAIAGSGWSCTLATLSCTRSDSLAAGLSYPAITVTVSVNSNAAATVTNTATVSGGGETDSSNDTATDLTAIAAAGLIPPTNVAANADSLTQITVSWNTVAAAVKYQVFRSSNHSALVALPGFATSPPFVDLNVAGGTTYVYMVEAVDGSNTNSAPSNVEIATTILFTDDTIVPGSTVIKAAHLAELRTAVNAVRAAAGLTPPATFTDTALAGVAIKALHINELRSDLDAARAAIGVPPLAYTDSTLLAGAPVKAAHIQELRAGVK